MKNITLSLHESLLEGARKYAAKHKKTINQLIRDLLTKTVKPSRVDGLQETFRRADELGIDSKGVRWTRDELHER